MDPWLSAALLAPCLYYVRELPDRARDLHEGRRGLLAAPVALAVMAPLGLAALSVSDHPVLGWSWYGGNVALEPARSAAGQAAGGSAGGLAAAAGLLALLGLALVLLVYYEEAYFRGSWAAVAVWALMHVLVGVQVAAVLPLLGAGAVYKTVHDRWGLEEAYAAHLAVNALAVSALAAALLL